MESKEYDLAVRVIRANKQIIKAGLVLLTFGNASVIDEERKMIYIKPSGININKILPRDVSKVSIEGFLESGRKFSVDTPIHLELYKTFPQIGGIVHTHSTYATIFCQAEMELHCYGTTHADYFRGTIPVSRKLEESEINNDYEKNIGKSIIGEFHKRNINPLDIPACFVASHGPFVFGKTIEEAVENAIVLEKAAELAYHTHLLISSGNGIYGIAGLPESLLTKHFSRKHGPDKYYGQ